MCSLLDSYINRVVESAEDYTWRCNVRELRVSRSSDAVIDDSADYRKYGVISFTKSEDSKKPDKLENKAKKQKVRRESRSDTDDDRLGTQVLLQHPLRCPRNYPLALGVERWNQRAQLRGARPVHSPYTPVSILGLYLVELH